METKFTQLWNSAKNMSLNLTDIELKKKITFFLKNW